MELTIIKKKDARVNRKTGEIIVGKLRVTAYARVSTGDKEQLDSYASQVKYYKEKIGKNPEWSYVNLYSDEGISGTTDYKRSGFMQMINDALQNKFDMIITKSISRFARNTLDTLKYVRMLKERNIAILFEEEDINTLEMAGELLLTVLSSVAQQESETISSHVKLGHKMRKERGEIPGNARCYGYDYNSKEQKFIIIPEEAEIVKYIFHTFLEGHGAEYIARTLTKMEVPSPKSKKKWHESTVRKILCNEKYKGDVLLGKTITIDPISHKRIKNQGEEDQYYLSNHHKAIIEPNNFDKVQEIMKARSGARANGKRLGNISKKFTFSGRLKCGYCGDSFCRRSVCVRQGKAEPTWNCITFTKIGKYKCPNSKAIKEDLLENAFNDTFKLLTKDNGIAMNEFVNIIKTSIRDKAPEEKINEINKQKESIKEKMSKLVDMVVDGKISDELFENKKNYYKEKNDKLDKKIEQYQLITEDNDKVESGINKIRNILENKDLSYEEEKFDAELFDALIDYVIIGGFNENGQKDEYMIRFICKKTFKFAFLEEKSIEKIIANNTINKDGTTQDYIPVLDFICGYHFATFENINGKREKILHDKIRVRLEVER
ncbi:MAG: recombinase family protein [Clostridia bacterium]|nr:recombinase family protein [Clostridia bacterium]